MDPPIEDLLDKVDSKFTLVALGSARARQVNAYYNSLGEGIGRVVPPQVTSVSGKPLSIAFEEIAAGKATYTRIDPSELEEAEEADGELVVGDSLELAELVVAETSTILGEPVVDSAALESEDLAVEDLAVEDPVVDEASSTDPAALAGEEGPEGVVDAQEGPTDG